MQKTALEDGSIKIPVSVDGGIRFDIMNVCKAFAGTRRVERKMDLIDGSATLPDR